MFYFGFDSFSPLNFRVLFCKIVQYINISAFGVVIFHSKLVIHLVMHGKFNESKIANRRYFFVVYQKKAN